MPTQTKKIAYDSAILFLGKVIGLLLGVIRLNYVALYLGVNNFGILNFALSYVSLFQVLFDFGLTQLLARDLSRNLEQTNEIVGKTVLLKFMIVFAAGIIIIGSGFISKFEDVTFWAIVLTTISFSINGISMVFLGAFQAHRMMNVISLYYLLNDLLLSLLVILLISQSPYVITILIFTVFVSSMNLMMLFFIYRRKIGMPKINIDFAYWKLVLKETTPIAISSIGISMYNFIGPTILKYVRSDSEVGIFWSGYKLISILAMIPMSFSQVVYPLFSNFYVYAKDKLEKSLSDSLRVMVIIAVPLAIYTIVLAKDIFELIYTPEFFSGMIVLQIALVGNVFGYMDWILYSFLLAISRQRFLMILSISAGITATIIGILIIPIGGYISLPIMQMTIEIGLFISQIFFLSYLGNNSFSLSIFIKPLFASIPGFIILLFLTDINLFIKGPICILFYAVCMFLLKGFGDQEKEIIQNVISKFKMNA